MKGNMMRKIFSMSLVLMATIAISANAQENTVLPQRMEPGSIIKIDDNKEISIISGGYISEKLDKNEFVLPEVEAGMRVSYDGLGNPTKAVNEKTGQQYNIEYLGKEDIKKVANNSIGITPNAAGSTIWKYQGWVTWFTDYIGQQNHVLQDLDCATKQSLEDPPCGTNIKLVDLSNSRTGYLTKWDVGSLPNAVLDIRPYAFTNVFGYNQSIGHFQGKYGHFIPY